MVLRAALTKSLQLVFGLLFPAYASIHAIESGSTEDDTQWLIYWLCYSLLAITESLAWPFLRWVPLYGELKAILLIWMVMPQTKGAHWVYEAVLAPTLAVARQQLANVPALESLLERYAHGDTATIPPMPTDGVQRKQVLNHTLQDATNQLNAQLERISNLDDPAESKKAERAFNKNLQRLSKIAAGDNGFFTPLGLKAHAG
jgi:hypothetical protein